MSMSTSRNGMCVFGGEFEANKPAEQVSNLNHVISKAILKKTYSMNLSITATIDGTTVSANEELLYHYCHDLHYETTQADYERFKREVDTENRDERVFYIED